MTVNDNTIKAEGIGKLFKRIGKTSVKATKKVTRNVMQNPARAL